MRGQTTHPPRRPPPRRPRPRNRQRRNELPRTRTPRKTRHRRLTEPPVSQSVKSRLHAKAGKESRLRPPAKDKLDAAFTKDILDKKDPPPDPPVPRCVPYHPMSPETRPAM